MNAIAVMRAGSHHGSRGIQSMIDAILTLNAGSTSLKFAVFELGSDGDAIARYSMSVVGAADHACLTPANEPPPFASSLEEAIEQVCGWASNQHHRWRFTHIANRIVHGGPRFIAPVQLDAQVLRTLEALVPLAPLHQAANISCARRFMMDYPNALHFGSFDTAFHATMPRSEKSFALPKIWFDRGVRRYGFHGLSYEWTMHCLTQSRPDLANKRIIAAHLGGGSSLCAIRYGRSVATTMGMTAIDGVAMATRSGAIDPGAVLYLAQESVLGLAGTAALLNQNAGLKGLSGLSGDVRELRASTDPDARFALDFFARRIADAAGSLSVSIGGIDAFVFSGGIGANDAVLRSEIISQLSHLPAFEVLSLETDEEWVLAHHAQNHALQRSST